MSMEDLVVEPGLVIPGHELSIATSRSGGPGGQHVNTTATRVTLRWNVRATEALDPSRRDRLIARLGNRVTADGDLLVHVSSSRSQSQNRSDAFERLAQLVRKALVERKKRKPTRPSRSSKERRLREKKEHSGRKAARRGPSADD
jgi:ribosome-associated protein